jgi:zinc transport system substrate-binding protein
MGGRLLIGLSLALFLAISPSGFAGGQSERLKKKPLVFVSIPPQAYFIERVGGNGVDVEVMAPAGQDPHTFEPTPRQLARLATADVYFRIGVESENALVPKLRSAMPDLLLVDTREGIRLREMNADGGQVQAAAFQPQQPGGSGGGSGQDPHFWLDPMLAKRQAMTLRDTLIAIDPAGRREYETNYAALAGDLDSLHLRLSRALQPLKGRNFFVFHPAFGYLADAYGLHQVAVETGGAEPSARQLARLIERAKEEEIRVLFVQPQFSKQSAETIAQEIGALVVAIDPLARDYIRSLEKMASQIAQGIR